MAKLLLELYSEEIPASMQQPAASRLHDAIVAAITTKGLTLSQSGFDATQHRVVVWVDGLPLKVKAESVEKRGPRSDAPQKAIEGFARSCGVAIETLALKETPKGSFYFHNEATDEQNSADILAPLICAEIKALKWPKSMLWGAHGIRWVRPLHSILCLLDDAIIPVEFGHLKASNTTKGHRFLSPDAITITSKDHYYESLSAAHVALNHDDRKQRIIAQAEAQALEKEVLLCPDEGLLNEVAGLVEWPVVHCGAIDPRFMQLPDEVLKTSMRNHQKYFSCLDQRGTLAPYFIAVANHDAGVHNAAITKGFERVLRARLEDAMFFWDQDRRVNLEEKAKDLVNVTFHAKLGSVADKVQRVTALAKLFAMWIPHANLLQVERAAQLCKADLTTQMVSEFTELQGIMGSYYAAFQKEDKEVAAAIYEHYKPLGPSDTCPTAPVSLALSLADKIDTLVGLFAVGQAPTASKDPFALRRAALGVIRMIIENNLRIPLKLLFEKSIANYSPALFKQKTKDETSGSKTLLALDALQGKKKKTKKGPKQITDQLLTFFEERFKTLLKDEGVRYDVIASVFNSGAEDDLARLAVRARALQALITQPLGERLLAAYRRATNIVIKEEANDNTVYNASPDKSALTEPQEVALYEAFSEISPALSAFIKEESYDDAMRELAKLSDPIDAFMDGVMVNCDQKNLRKQRLLLLAQFRMQLDQVADFTKIEA